MVGFYCEFGFDWALSDNKVYRDYERIKGSCVLHY